MTRRNVSRGIMAVATVLAVVLAFTTTSHARPEFVPEGANIRIDVDGGNGPSVKGYWAEIADYGDWGQGQCQPPGYECHRWDWITWWMPSISEPPVVPGTDGSEYFDPYVDVFYNESCGCYESGGLS